jgi:hypothetical protein
MIRAFTLVFHRCLESILNPTPPPLTQLHCTWALTYVRKYVWIICALAPNIVATPFEDTTGVLTLVICWSWYLLFCPWFHTKMEIILDWKTFIFALARSLRLSSTGPLDMVYELLWEYFVLNDYTGGFDLLKKICGHIVWSHVPPLVSSLFFTFRLLMLEK